MKHLIKKILKNRGYMIIPFDNYLIKIENVRYKWLQKIKPGVIIDVGASNGGFAKKIRKIIPEAQLYCFEPLIQSYNSLLDNFSNDKNFKSYNIAISDFTGVSDFYECVSSGSSSILEMTDVHKKAYPNTSENRKITIQVDTLDNVLFEKLNLQDDIVLLKIDVQGAEALVLRGAEKTLKLTDIIFTEINFSETYKDCVKVNDLIRILESFDFVLYGIENVSQSLNDGSFLQADAFFVKKTLKNYISI
ncbi:MAG: FkbM family methyltransferase [Bacteroidales bacterium]|nr:FkbM family methyltransferase [Bacteroidales bacterium]